MLSHSQEKSQPPDHAIGRPPHPIVRPDSLLKSFCGLRVAYRLRAQVDVFPSALANRHGYGYEGRPSQAATLFHSPLQMSYPIGIQVRYARHPVMTMLGIRF
jgi:hypothetical protein